MRGFCARKGFARPEIYHEIHLSQRGSSHQREISESELYCIYVLDKMYISRVLTTMAYLTHGQTKLLQNMAIYVYIYI